MSSPAQPELVRHHQRQACAVDALLRVAQEHAERVVISPSVCDSSGRVPVRIVDVSAGGLGLHCALFVPLRTLVEVVIEAGQPGDAGGLFGVQVRVQRITMLSREPRYYLGVAFTDQGNVAALRERLGASAAQGNADA